MKRIMNTHFFIALLLSASLCAAKEVQKPQQNACAVTCKAKTQVATLVWTTDVEELKKAESAFVDSFFEVYSKIEIKRFGNIKPETDDKPGHDAAIKKFLNTAFSNQVKALEKNAVECVVAKVGDKVVGFATFEKTGTPGEIYVDQLAVDAEHQGKGIGKQLVFSILEKHKDIKKILVITRNVNEVAKAFYHKIGFKTSSYMHPDYSDKLYIGYEMEVK